MQLLCIVTLEKSNHKLKVRKSPYLFFFRGNTNANQILPPPELEVSP
nr:MAG TPA: hypothetical protein [Caudoviricetes sp.]